MSLLLAQQQIHPQTAQEPNPGVFSVEEVAGATGCPRANVAANWPLVVAALRRLRLDDRPTEAAAAATIAVETGDFSPREELRNADGSIPEVWYSYDGGPDYHGRGLIQLTHLDNYRTYGEILGLDLVGNPDLATDPMVAAEVLVLFFRDHGIPILAAAGDWRGVRRAVQGGLGGWAAFRRVLARLGAVASR